MAKIELKFLDYIDHCWIKCVKSIDYDISQDIIEIQMYNELTKDISCVNLDKSTAIKFAKTLRTEINKIQE